MGYFNNGIGAARINDSSPSDYTTYSGNKIESMVSGNTDYIECTQAQYDAWEQAGTLLEDTNYYITDGQSGGGVVIDDTTASSTTVYSSDKVEDLLSDKQDATDNSLDTTDKTIVGAINELLSDVGDNSSDITDIITNMGGMKAKTYTVEGNGGLLTLPSYNNVCLIFIGRGEGGLYFGHWTGVTPLVNASNHNVIYYSNPSRINVTNNSGSTDMVLVLSN